MLFFIRKLIEVDNKKRKKYQALNLKEKINLSQKIIKTALKRYGWQNTAVAWTGGKDSTLMLWLIKQTVENEGWPMPKIMFVDEGDVFPAIRKFTQKIGKKWGFEFSVAHNDDVSSKAKKIGDRIWVKDLNKINKAELKKLGFKGKSFKYQPESLIGNHLMKTTATKIWLRENKVKALFVGVRWDEQPARAEDDFFRQLKDPPHFRVEPLLHFKEKDVWQTIHQYKIPYVNLYQKGYRSLGAKTTTQRPDSKPAWKQNRKKIKERDGRQQDKEKIMARLRALGYM